jgi:hypothetical protein
MSVSKALRVPVSLRTSLQTLAKNKDIGLVVRMYGDEVMQKGLSLNIHLHWSLAI